LTKQQINRSIQPPEYSVACACAQQIRPKATKWRHHKAQWQRSAPSRNRADKYSAHTRPSINLLSAHHADGQKAVCKVKTQQFLPVNWHTYCKAGISTNEVENRFDHDVVFTLAIYLSLGHVTGDTTGNKNSTHSRNLVEYYCQTTCCSWLAASFDGVICGRTLHRNSAFSRATSKSCFSYSFTNWVNLIIPAIEQQRKQRNIELLFRHIDSTCG